MRAIGVRHDVPIATGGVVVEAPTRLNAKRIGYCTSRIHEQRLTAGVRILIVILVLSTSLSGCGTRDAVAHPNSPSHVASMPSRAGRTTSALEHRRAYPSQC